MHARQMTTLKTIPQEEKIWDSAGRALLGSEEHKNKKRRGSFEKCDTRVLIHNHWNSNIYSLTREMKETNLHV